MFGSQPIGMHRPAFVPPRQGDEAAAAAISASNPAASLAPMAAFMALPHHQEALNETNSNTIKCIPDYRNRIKKIIKFWKSDYPDYYEQVVVQLTPEQRANKRVFHTSTQDLQYNILDPLALQNFMSANKVKPNGKEYSFDHIRKYHDAILFCEGLAELVIPATYKSSMKAYLDNMKKEKTKAKSGGKTDEQEADQIPYALYKEIFSWALESGNLMVWAFTVVQWNVMGRSCNVAPLGFCNLSRKEANDSVVIEFDTNKQDQTGVNTSPKNCYANPFQPLTCMFLALGC